MRTNLTASPGFVRTTIAVVGAFLAALALTIALTAGPAAGIPGEPTEPVIHQPPDVTRNAATVTVTEGQTASNSGSFDDTADDDADSVTISVKGEDGRSLGQVIQDGSETGTWSWQLLTTDGPAESQTVTVTARDDTGRSSSTSFTLTVNNAPPTASGISAPNEVLEGRTFSISLNSPTDPSSVDRSSLKYAFDCGSGVFSAFSETNSRSCTAGTGPGQVTVSGRIMDKDSGMSLVAYTKTVTITDDATRPTVVDTDAGLEPDRGALGVPRTTNVSATFSEEMDPNTLSSTTFKLQMFIKKTKKWRTIPATMDSIIVSNGRTTATLDPFGATEGSSETLLAANKKFRGFITTGAKDLAGNPLARNFSWTFKTGG